MGEDKNKLYKIGQIAEKANIPVSTINYYLNEGLIKSKKTTSSGYRLFSEVTVNKVLKIREMQAEYLPLRVIKERLESSAGIRKKKRLTHKQTGQLVLQGFEPEYPAITFRFPSTRYQGSKLKLVEWIWQNVKHLNFETVLDAFGGTGAVSYLFKTKGKHVFYNDILKFNYYIGLALIENSKETLDSEDINILFKKHSGIKYSTFIQDTFKNTYFTDEENTWLDMVVTNINLSKNKFKKALTYFCLFQSCIAKRPFNLFHRKNLYIRTANVKRSFGNKITWDTPFPVHFVRFAEEVNESIFSNGKKNKAFSLDAFDIEGEYDLIYIDTPYISSKGVGVDYLEFYHFLEGLVNYDRWGELIDEKSRHKHIKHDKSVWTDKNKIHQAFDKLFERFKNSILVVSYRADGIPSDKELMEILRRYKSDVVELNKKNYKYVLSNNGSEELLFVAQ